MLEKYQVIYKRIGGPQKKCLVERLAIVIIYYLDNCYLPHFMQSFFLGLGKVFVPYVLKKKSCFI